MEKLTQAQTQEREKLVAWMVEKVGAEKAEAWMKDPSKLAVINAMAAQEVK